MRRLHVAMNDSKGVGGRQTARDLFRIVERANDRQTSVVANDLAQRSADDKLHDDKRPLVPITNVIHGDDVRTVDLRRGSRFSSESLKHDRVTLVV